MQTSNGIRGLSIAIVLTGIASAEQVQVSITNLAPAAGTYLTPVWLGIHDGTFDTYDQGSASSVELERIAEDGNTEPLSGLFAASAAGIVQATAPGPNGPIAPGETATAILDLGGSTNGARYLSYVSMIIPSNDAFVANGNPLVHPIFDAGGTFQGADFIVLGSQVLDAGTEVNDELPVNTAFFGQSVPDTGVPQGGTVLAHPGFLPASSGGILADPMFANADFLQPNFQVARIRVSLVPEPASSALVLTAAGLLGGFWRRALR